MDWMQVFVAYDSGHTTRLLEAEWVELVSDVLSVQRGSECSMDEATQEAAEIAAAICLAPHSQRC